jgi:hypothetical protein
METEVNCKQCGIENSEDAKFCPECGVSVTGENPPPLPSTAEGVPRNYMVPVPDRATVLRSPPFWAGKQWMPLRDARATYDENPVYKNIPVGKLALKRFGVVFLSKGEIENWKTILEPAADYAIDEIFNHVFGIGLGPYYKTKAKDEYEKSAEEFLAKSPATVVIPAPVIVNVKAEKLNKFMYIRITDDEGRVFSIASGDQLFGQKHWPNVANMIWMIRSNYESFYFLGSLLSALLPDEKRTEILAETAQQLFTNGLTKELGAKIDGLIQPKGMNCMQLSAESDYHRQRWTRGNPWGAQTKEQLKWIDEIPEYHPTCFSCKLGAKRSKAKYCEQCGLSLC